MTQEKLPHRKELCLQSERHCVKIHSAFYVFASWIHSIGRKYIELYNELCNLSKYYYATKKGLTKQNYTKYTKKQTDA